MKFKVHDCVILDQKILGWVVGFVRATHNPLENRIVIKWENGDIKEYYYRTEVGRWYLEKCIKVASAMDILNRDLEKYKGVWERLAKL